jgi:hypothetical protein
MIEAIRMLWKPLDVTLMFIGSVVFAFGVCFIIYINNKNKKLVKEQ